VSGTGAASALEGTTVVVTGANSGMGEATAAALAAMGAITVLTARDRVRGEEAVGRVVARPATNESSSPSSTSPTSIWCAPVQRRCRRAIPASTCP
jgi:retinol dehydrogenase-14